MIGRCLGLIPAGTGWEATYARVNNLVGAGVTVLWCQAPVALDRESVPAGGFLVPLGGLLNPALSADGLRSACTGAGTLVEGEPVGPVVACRVPSTRIAFYADAGAPYSHLAALAAQGFVMEPITAVQIQQGDLRSYDLLVVPGGGVEGMPGQLRPLGEAGAQAIAAFVAAGGGYLSSCAGSYLASALVTSEVPLIGAAQPRMCLVAARPINGAGAGVSGFLTPGIGEVRLRKTADHPVMLGLPDEFPCTHYNGPFFAPDPDRLQDQPRPEVLARVVGAGASFTAGEAFFGPAPEGAGLLEQAVAQGAAALVAGYYGKGAVMLAGSHPEFGLDPVTMAVPGPAARMLGNAVWWLTLVGRGNCHRVDAPPDGADSTCWTIPAGPPDALPAALLAAIRRLVRRLADEGAEVPNRPGCRAHWGMSAPSAWAYSLAELERRADAIGRRWLEVVRLAGDLAHSVPAAPLPRAEEVRSALSAFWRATGYRRPGDWRQDLGYRGFLPLLELCRDQLAEGLTLAAASDSGSRCYDLVARSYLSAIGVLVGAEAVLVAEEHRLAQVRERLAWALRSV